MSPGGVDEWTRKQSCHSVWLSTVCCVCCEIAADFKLCAEVSLVFPFDILCLIGATAPQAIVVCHYQALVLAMMHIMDRTLLTGSDISAQRVWCT